MWGSSPTFFLAPLGHRPWAPPMSIDPLLESIRQQVAALGFELVDFHLGGARQRPVIQVRIDRPDSSPGQGVTAEDCMTVSRALERFLEQSGRVGPRYELETSSPGIERPVRFPEHWRRFVGRTVRLRAAGLSGRPEAVIVRVPDDAHVVLRLPDGSEPVIALDDVREAHLVVGDLWAGLRQKKRKNS